MAFQFASTNLVAELSIIMILVLGWPFAAAEFLGGPLMVVILAVLFRAFLRRELVEEARRQADRGLVGSMEGHAEMDMSVTNGTLWQRITSPQGFTAISHYFVMDWSRCGGTSPAGCSWPGRWRRGSPRSSGRPSSSWSIRWSRCSGGRWSGRSSPSSRSSAQSDR